MERILVSLDIRKVALEAVYRAIHLATRINAEVHLLFVVNGAPELADNAVFNDLDGSTKSGLDLTLAMGRAAGVSVETFVVQGVYEEEVIRFVQQKGITLLVFGLPEADARTSREFGRALRHIRKQVSCAIELVRYKEPSFSDGEIGDQTD